MIRNLCSAVKRRREGRSASSGSGPVRLGKFTINILPSNLTLKTQ
jgi:hypothetical protein